MKILAFLMILTSCGHMEIGDFSSLLPWNALRPYDDERKEQQNTFKSEGKDAISDRPTSREIFIGMDKNRVIKLWGRPSKVEIAGESRYENEKWTFYNRNGKKIVYFEQGKVGGWALK